MGVFSGSMQDDNKGVSNNGTIKRNNELTTINNKLSKKNSELEVKIDQIVSENEELKRHLKNFNLMYCECIERCSALSDANDSLKTQVASLEAWNTEVSNNFNAKAKEAGELQMMAQKKNIEIEFLNAKIASYENLFTQLEGRIYLSEEEYTAIAEYYEHDTDDIKSLLKTFRKKESDDKKKAPIPWSVFKYDDCGIPACNMASPKISKADIDDAINKLRVKLNRTPAMPDHTPMLKVPYYIGVDLGSCGAATEKQETLDEKMARLETLLANTMDINTYFFIKDELNTAREESTRLSQVKLANCYIRGLRKEVDNAYHTYMYSRANKYCVDDVQKECRHTYEVARDKYRTEKKRLQGSV